MSDCERFEERISALIDGELSAEEEAEVRAHMAGCAGCAAMYEAFSAVGEALRADASDVPATLHSGIMEKVSMAEKATRTQKKIIRLRPILTAAACLVVLVGTLLAVKNTVGMRKGAAAPATEAPAAVYATGGASAGSSGADAAVNAETPMIMAAQEAAPEMAEAESEAMFDSAAMDSAAPETAREEKAAAKTEATAEEPAAGNAPYTGSDAASVDAGAAKENGISPRLAEARSFTMRLESVQPGKLSGVVTDPGDQNLLAQEAQVTVLHDGAELLASEIGKLLVVFIPPDAQVTDGCVPTIMIRSAE